MREFTTKYMITGNPGVGKTTFILKLHDYLKNKFCIGGFYTEEIRDGGQRTGFKIATFQGIEKVLTSVDMKSKYRVGRYGVSVSHIDEFIHSIHNPVTYPEIWLIDEIGKMESFSALFRSFIEKIMTEKIPAIATVSKSAGGWISQIRQHADVRLLNLTYENREQLLNDFIQNTFLKQN